MPPGGGTTPPVVVLPPNPGSGDPLPAGYSCTEAASRQQRTGRQLAAYPSIRAKDTYPCALRPSGPGGPAR
ncbi:MAG: hypothetical protein WKG07_10015 [Hymenobacter sp.]